ncbi:MAG: hypothetical protein FJX75_14245 [Armatimonadetes bacterium]|nr:hypothetical protein [Armatimonadota bacterium]
MRWLAFIAALGTVSYRGAPAQDVRDDYRAPESIRGVEKVPLRVGLTLTTTEVTQTRVVGVTPEGIEWQRYVAREDHVWSQETTDREDLGVWFPLSSARGLPQAIAGHTIVRLPRPDGNGLPEYLFAGVTEVACQCNGEMALVRCWNLVTRKNSLLVMADPDNPLIMASVGHVVRPLYETLEVKPPRPDFSCYRVVCIDGPDIKFAPPGQ